MDITFVPGQHVAWRYRPGIFVDAEIVQFGQQRTRIRIRTTHGDTLFRWVHPKNLRPKAPDEPDYPYPEVR